MIHLPADEDRLRDYTRLMRERFGDWPQKISEGAGLVSLPIPLCPDCLLPKALCVQTSCGEVY